MTSPDYYSLLEVPRDATLEDVRRAYRRLAVKWHPDKNLDNKDLAEIRFKEISEAYQVLSDDLMRSQYDHYTDVGASGEQPSTFTFLNPTELFREFFGTSDPFGDLSGDVHVTGGGGGGYAGPRFATNGFAWQEPTLAVPFGMNIDHLTLQEPVPVPLDAQLTDVFQIYSNILSPPPADLVTEVTTVRYVDGRWVNTCTISKNDGTVVLRYENGELVSGTEEPVVDPHVDDVAEEMQVDQEEATVPETCLLEQQGPSDDEEGSSGAA